MSTKGSRSDSEDILAEERRLFEQAMSDVRPLKNRGTASPTSLDGKTPVPATTRTLSAVEPSPALVDGPQVRGRTGGVSEATLWDLAKGEFPVDGTCNLHGYREGTARRRIESFVRESREAKRRVVAVVCGRGLHSGPLGPVLRQVCLEELSKHMAKGSVLAVASAPPRLGGEGALLVLLRKDRG